MDKLRSAGLSTDTIIKLMAHTEVLPEVVNRMTQLSTYAGTVNVEVKDLLGDSKHAPGILERNGISSVELLTLFSREDLLELDGIGKITVDRIEVRLAELSLGLRHNETSLSVAVHAHFKDLTDAPIRLLGQFEPYKVLSRLHDPITLRECCESYTESEVRNKFNGWWDVKSDADLTREMQKMNTVLNLHSLKLKPPYVNKEYLDY